MNNNIYNVYPAIELQSGKKIYLQSISLSHTYSGLLCGFPNEQINNSIVLDINNEFPEGLFIIDPQISMMNENYFFGKINPYHDNQKQIPVMPPVKVDALFECYDGEEMSYLNIVWFQDEYALSTPKEIQDIDWDNYASEVSL